ncbi:MAG: DUF4130 domain-containing protein [archaeon]|nr:DUF4130 domain-containing protein [archaeon]
MMEATWAESHRLKVFTRLQLFPEMLLFGEISPRAEVVENVLDFFSHRFPTFVIALHEKETGKFWIASRRKDFEIFASKKIISIDETIENLRKTLAKTFIERIDLSVPWNEEFYSAFYDSQFIEPRKNLKIADHMMPAQFLSKDLHEFHAMKAAKRTKPNTSLKQFV